MCQSSLETNVQKPLQYFGELRQAAVRRKDGGNVNWEKTFLAKETWRNLRIACRGFFEYCRAIIKFAKDSGDDIPAFYAVSVAHSNSSVLEAWFSLVRNMRLDSATSYGSAVGNKQMRSNCSLATNGMYAKEQVGPLLAGSPVGPSEEKYCRVKAAEYVEKSLAFDTAPSARVFPQEVELE